MKHVKKKCLTCNILSNRHTPLRQKTKSEKPICKTRRPFFTFFNGLLLQQVLVIHETQETQYSVKENCTLESVSSVLWRVKVGLCRPHGYDVGPENRQCTLSVFC